MKKLLVLTPWVEILGPDDQPCKSPAVMQEYPFTMNGESMKDITGQPVENITPDPNLLLVEMVRADETAAALALDPRFYTVSEEPAP